MHGFAGVEPEARPFLGFRFRAPAEFGLAQPRHGVRRNGLAAGWATELRSWDETAQLGATRCRAARDPIVRQ